MLALGLIVAMQKAKDGKVVIGKGKRVTITYNWNFKVATVNKAQSPNVCFVIRGKINMKLSLLQL